MSYHSFFVWEFDKPVDEEALYKELLEGIEYNLKCWTGCYWIGCSVDLFMFVFINAVKEGRDLSDDNSLDVWVSQMGVREPAAIFKRLAKRLYFVLKERGTIK